MKRILQRASSAVLFASVLALATSASAQSESAGVNQYFTNCASCHESNEPGHQAPPTAVLKRLTPERILEVMTTGSMQNAAASLTDQDKRLIAEWVGGRKLDADLIGAAEKMSNVCASHPQVRESNGPAWNGWGVDYRNSRFQPAAAAGLTPGQVSRLQLKWAFGFPGATALYSQTVYEGRLYVTSNAGYVYSLDAESGCLHWSFRAQSAVRSGLTIGRLSRTDSRLAIFFGDIHGTAYALSASSGEELWKTLTDPHPLARITGTPVLLEGRLVRAGRLARRAGVGTGRLHLLHVPRLHVGARCGHWQADLEDVYDSGNAASRRQELAGQGHACTGRRRHLGNAHARHQATGALRHDGQRVSPGHRRRLTRSWR
jgi:cytochrome c553